MGTHPVASKAHVVSVRKLPAVRKAKVVVEFSCPSGCLTGYFWTNDEGDADRVAQAIIGAHQPSAEPPVEGST